MKITDKDNELIEIATELVKDNCDIYTSLGMHVGCVVLAKSGIKQETKLWTQKEPPKL
mgnify:CR=1 FL=1